MHTRINSNLLRLGLGFCILVVSSGWLMAAEVRWDFTQPGTTDGWTLQNIAKNSVTNRVWTIEAARGCPLMISPQTKIDTVNQPVITVRMKLAKGLGTAGCFLFLSDAAPNWDDKTIVSFSPLGDGEWHTYEVDMSKNQYWKGTATQIRFQPINIADTALTKENAIVQLQYLSVLDIQAEVSGSSSGRELIQNGGFEEMDALGNPAGWKRFSEDHLQVDRDEMKQYGRSANSLVSSESHAGKHSVMIDIPSSAKEIGGWSTRVALKPKTTYTLTFQAKAQGKPASGVKVEEYGADGVRKTCFYTLEPYTGEWREYRLEFESKPETVGALVTIYIWESSGKFWVDDISLKEFSFSGGAGDVSALKKGETPVLHLTREVVTPHIAWATPWSGGRLRVLAIPPHREVVELAQRLDMDFTAWQKEIPQFMDFLGVLCYDTPERGLAYFAKSFFWKMSQPLDVIMVGKYDLAGIPQAFKSALLKKVADGTGLIVVRPRDIGWLSPAMQNVLPIPDSVVAGVPFDALPALGGESKGDKWLKCYSYGKGRVAVVNYYNENLKFLKCQPDYFSGLNLPFTPETSFDPDSKSLRYDYHQSWLAKLVLWAGQKESKVAIAGLSAERGSISLMVKSPDAFKNASVEVTVRDLDGVVEMREKRPLQINAGETNFTQAIAPMKSGRHLVDVWIRDAAGKVLNWGSVSLTTSSVVNVIGVKTGKFSYLPEEHIEGTISTDQPLPSETKIRLQLRDTLGRLLDENDVKGDGRKEISFSLPLRGTVAIVHEIVAGIRDRTGRVISEGKCEFVVKKPFDPLDDFRFYSWGAHDGNNCLESFLLTDMYRRGLDGVYLCNTLYDSPADEYRANLLYVSRRNLLTMTYTTGQLHEADPPESNLTIPSRPFAAKAFRDGLYNELFKKSTVSRDFPMPAYSLGDEIGVSVYGQDFDFSPSGLAFIRDYLKAQYGDLGKLNTEWGKSYTSWDQVMPMTLKEARTYGRFAPWIDLRTAISAMWTDTVRFAIDAVRKGDPGARVGGEGMCNGTGGMSNGEDSFNGYDFGQVIPEGKMWGCYFQNPQYPDIEFLRSFAAPDSALWTFTNPFEDYPGGFFSDYYRVEKTDRYLPWFDLFNGMNGTNFWDSRALEWWGWYSKDLRVMPWGENIFGTMQEIKSGIGKMILKSTRQNNSIGIYYSPVNFHVEMILNGRERKESPRAFCALLEDLGLQYDFVSKEQMAAGKLSRYKFLVLPYVRALSETEAQGMRAFVAGGGVLFADGPAGIMNEHGSKVETNRLSGVALTTATNPLWKYMSVRDTADGLIYRKEVKEALKKAGIEARYRIVPKDGREMNGCEMVEWKAGNAVYLGILQGREYIRKKEEDAGRPVTIALPGKYHVYSVREKKYLGYVASIETTIESAVAKIYALMPTRTRGISIGGVKNSYGRGASVEYEILAGGDVGKGVPHTFRVEVYRPDGRLYQEYTSNLYAANGRANGVFRLALNDTPGRWRVVASDVATGVRMEVGFTVK